VDRRDGKPKQALAVSGGLVHGHTAYRDPLLAGLSDEELKALNTITGKLALPAPDTPQNQTQSNTAILTVEVVPEAIQEFPASQEASTEASQDGQFAPETSEEKAV
jgi:hypothetical protein